ncbi:MAG: hypothetical protein HOE62_16690 [Alphaproteobacteria bacterium]|jgi:hypothetical protein|nr:hypothetical protein [Alphaproteobacteria bacterium]MBT4019593.1 hypothetical protein [Alphaproteobacteria bacterium]MBT5158283.1 hypothetical protein [Alphaproteobacteria bacterium]MBT5917680.1 hypothetical protein [Alphaproteobacteria bacterium]MBT6386291.1 hypothetical protein [Alphaproteobacteria bacterium]
MTTNTLKLDHIIAYAADNSLAEAKACFGEYGITPHSPDRTDIGNGVHAAYFRLGDIVLEFLSVVEATEFAAANGTMPFSEDLRQTRAVFAPGYHHDDLEKLNADFVAEGQTGLKSYVSGTADEPDRWTYILLEDVLCGTAAFICYLGENGGNPEYRNSCDALGLGRVAEMWFVADQPVVEAELWLSTFSSVAECTQLPGNDRRSLKFEGRTLSWMSPEVYVELTGKEPPSSVDVKFGQLSAFMMSVVDRDMWHTALAVSNDRVIRGRECEGIHFDGPVDVAVLARIT